MGNEGGTVGEIPLIVVSSTAYNIVKDFLRDVVRHRGSVTGWVTELAFRFGTQRNSNRRFNVVELTGVLSTATEFLYVVGDGRIGP